jgi:hypothetical protein
MRILTFSPLKQPEYVITSEQLQKKAPSQFNQDTGDTLSFGKRTKKQERDIKARYRSKNRAKVKQANNESVRRRTARRRAAEPAPNSLINAIRALLGLGRRR